MDNTFENVLDAIAEEHRAFAMQLHDDFLCRKFKCKIENKATGFFVSYKNLKPKNQHLIFTSAKTGYI